MPPLPTSADETGWDLQVRTLITQQLDGLWDCVVPGPDGTALRTALDDAVTGGKRLRPRLVAEVHDALGGRRPAAVIGAAAAVELLHTAFVVHDDLIDGDDLRRGRPSVPGRFRAAALAQDAGSSAAGAYATAGAVLAGDLALSGAWRTFAGLDIPAPLHGRLIGLVGQALATSAAGELADVRLTIGDQWPTAEEVLELAARKTAAYSFVLPMAVGALLAGAEDHVVDLIARAGRSFGIAYQLYDDLAGMFDSTEVSGKDARGDLREGKLTLLMCHARDTTAWTTVQPLLGSPLVTMEELHLVRRALEDSGSRTFVESAAEQHLRTGIAHAQEAGIDTAAEARLPTLLRGHRARVAA